MAWGLPPPGGGGKRGRDTKVSLPLLTPQPFLWTRLPSVARLKARGPQGRLVLQGYTLDGSGAFRSRKRPLCTVWPRTVMRGELRKVNSGHNSVPKSARRTEPSPRNPRFAAHLRCVSAKEGEGSQEGTSTHLIRARRGKEDSGLRPKPYLVSCPLLPSAVGTASPPGDPGNPPAVGTAFSPPPDGGSPCRRRRQFLFYDGRQFPSRTQVVSLSRTIVTIYPFLPKLSATIRPSAVWKI